MTFTTWLLFVSPCAAFTSPHARARVESSLFAKDPVINNLLNEYSKASTGSKGIGIPESLVKNTPPVVDVPSAVDAPPVSLPPVDIPAAVAKINIPEAVLAKKMAAAEAVNRASPTGKPPSLGDWLTGGNHLKENVDKAALAAPIDGHTFDRMANFNEKMGILGHNVFGGLGDNAFGGLGDNSGVDLSKFAAGAATAGAVLNPKDFLDRLQLGEYGAWYLVVLTFVWGVAQKQAGKDDVEDAFREKLAKAEAKATEAAEYATMAADAASKVKKMVYTADQNTNKDANQDVLEATKAKIVQMDMVSEKQQKTRLVGRSTN